eukprot:4528398-Pleurochrysis_carterae.AAC.1
MWIEIWKDDYRGVILARMLWNTRQNTPEASILGVRLTEDTYRRLVSRTCSTATPTTLPDEFRRFNRRKLEAAAQRRAEAEGGGPSGVTTDSKARPSRLTRRLRPASRTIRATQEAQWRIWRTLNKKLRCPADPTEVKTQSRVARLNTLPL